MINTGGRVMKKLLPADCLPCGCVSDEMLSSFVSSCFRDWGKYGEGGEIGLSDCTTEVRWSTHTQMFMGMCGKACLVVFRGYDRFHLVIEDISTIALPFDVVNSGARVNGVFLNAYKEFRDDMMAYVEKHDPAIVYAVGHSMGGAMATLAAIDLAVNAKVSARCYTFGSPKVGDAWFRKIYLEKVETTERYVTPLDPIPLYPWDREYVHLSGARIAGSWADRFKMMVGSVKHFLMVCVGMAKMSERGRVITSFLGTDGHELYNYAFEIRKFGKDLI